MASSYTSNYQLCQWEGTDKVLRTDFNGDNAKIDAALAEKAEVVFGTYTGDGTASRVISLGFTPKAVYLCGGGGEAFTAAGTAYLTGGFFFGGCPLQYNGYTAASVVDGGFQVGVITGSYTIVRTNLSGKVYAYFAFR